MTKPNFPFGTATKFTGNEVLANNEQAIVDNSIVSDYFDPNLLVDESDSKETGLHLKIKDFSLNDLDLNKAKTLGYWNSTITGWLSGKHTVPLELIRNSAAIGPRILHANYKSSKFKVKFPKLDEKLFYFAGVVLGDGHISGVIRSQGYRRYKVQIQKLRTNFSEFYLPNLIDEIFGVKPKIYFWKKKSELVNINANSKIVSRVLTNVFGFSYGKKTDTPIDFVQKFPDNLQLQFIAGLWDTDGGKSGKTFAFCNSSKKMVLYVKDFMEKNYIETKFYEQHKGPFTWYLLFVRTRDTEKFLNLFPLKNARKYGDASGEI